MLSLKSERPSIRFAMWLYLPTLLVGSYVAHLAVDTDLLPKNPVEKTVVSVLIFCMALYLLWNYFGALAFSKLTWGDGTLGYRKGSPNWLYWPQTGFSGRYEVATTKHIYATFLGVMISGEGPGVAIPLPVGWKCMGEWFPPMVEACITNEGQMNYKVAKELESGRRFPPRPELAQRVREYLDAEGPFGGRVIKS